LDTLSYMLNPETFGYTLIHVERLGLDLT